MSLPREKAEEIEILAKKVGLEPGASSLVRRCCDWSNPWYSIQARSPEGRTPWWKDDRSGYSASRHV